MKARSLLRWLPLAAIAIATMAPAEASTTTYRVQQQCRGEARCFQTIRAAIEAADRIPRGTWVDIRVAAGNYREKIVLARGRVRLTGAGAERTRLHFDAVAKTAGRFDRAGWGTAGSATLTIDGDDVLVRGLTVENDYDYLANDALPSGDPRKIGDSQGVALQLDSNSDRVLLDRVSLIGNQDTVFTRGKRAVIRRSLVAGNVDFVFGSGMLLIEDSEVRSRRRSAPVPTGDFASFIAAPSTPLRQRFGLVFHRSRLTREPGVADRSVALARPWHPTTLFPDGRYADPDAIGQTAFIDCFMDRHIHPDHWTSMAGTARDGTKTRIFRPEESRFFESGSTGPGARSNGKVRSPGPTTDMEEVRRVLRRDWASID